MSKAPTYEQMADAVDTSRPETYCEECQMYFGNTLCPDCGMPEDERAATLRAAAEALRGIAQEPLKFEKLGSTCYRAPSPIYGNIRVESWGSGKWRVNFSVPGYVDDLIDQSFASPQKAMAAANDFVAAALLLPPPPEGEEG